MQAIVHCLGKIKSVSDLRYSQSGNPYLSFTFVQTSGYGENVHFDWYRATIFGKQAEGLAGKLVAGETRFYIVGKQRVELYDREDGTTGYTVEVSVNHFEFAGEKPHDDGDGERKPARPQGQQAKRQPQKPKEDAGDDDDVGF